MAIRTPAQASICLVVALALAARASTRCGADDAPSADPHGPDRFVAGDPHAQLIDKIANRCADMGVSGAILAARDGKVLVACGIGSADLEDVRPNTANTMFELASATKQFTASAILRLSEQGLLKLDDSISLHLPNVPDSCREITIRHLLQHRSGIPGTNSRGRGDDINAVVPVFLSGGPRHEPGTHWEYWNQGYALVSAIVEHASQRSYTDYCKEELFEKAGMRHSCFTGDVTPVDCDVAIGWSSRGQPRSALEHPYGSYGYQYRGMGGAVSNVWDLWKWDRALRGNDVLGEAATRELFDAGLNNYALGWLVARNHRGRLVQSHGGSVRGFVCELRRFPEDNGCLFVLCNRDDVPVRAFSDLLESAMFDEDVAMPPVALSPDLQDALAGTYLGPGGQQLIIEPDGETTRASILWRPGGHGPVTHALIGQDDAGALVLFEWSEVTEIGYAQNRHGQVTTVRMQSMAFSRNAPAD